MKPAPLLRRLAFCLMLASAMTAHAQGGRGGLPPWPSRFSAQSDVVFVGEVLSLDKGRAEMKVGEVLFGQLELQTVSVAPIAINREQYQRPIFAVGDEKIVFGKRAEGNQITVVEYGRGAIGFTPSTKETTLSAAKWFVAIGLMKDPAARQDAVLAEVKTTNPMIRAEVLRWIEGIGGISPADKQKALLISLLGDPATDVQRAALMGLRNVQADEAVPLMVKLTRSPSKDVVIAACMGLARYDSAESVGALIALSGNSDSLIRNYSCLGLASSKRLEAKAAMMPLLDDKDEWVRERAVEAIAAWLRRNPDDDSLPKIVEMLDDPIPRVRGAAAKALGDSRNSTKSVPPLLKALARSPLDNITEDGVLQALTVQYYRGEAAAKLMIDREIRLVVAVFKRGTYSAMDILQSSRRSEAVAAMQWAAELDSDPDFRDKAKRAQAKLDQSQFYFRQALGW